mgnify:CR=1 FL=1
MVTGGYIGSLGDTSNSFTYTQTNSGDGFSLKINLEVGAGDEDESSQRNCGLTPTPGVYAVCAN